MKQHKGFTLIELMMVVAIIGILTAVALPSYTRYVLQSHRAAAISALLDLGSREARYFTINNQYTTSMVTLGYSADPMPIVSSTSNYYNLSVASVTNSGTNFSIQAVPVGNQTKDSCGTFTYTDLGVKGVSSGTLSSCWQQ